ncbi:MAG: CpXC domain-containing protein [Methanomassiliicoccales archaeon]
MSKSIVYSLNCPRCGTENQVTVWDSVNVTLDPELKEQVLSGDLFQHQCPGCSFTGGIAHPCLYHDMDGKLLIYLVPPQEDGRADDLAGMDANPFPAEIMDGYIMRRVASVDRLREKVMIFDLGMDDRAIELYKWRVMEYLSDGDSGFKPVEAYFDSGGEEHFVVYDERGESMLIAFFHDLFLDIEKEFLPRFDKGPQPAFQTIDDAWAFSIINQGLPPYPPSDCRP